MLGRIALSLLGGTSMGAVLMYWWDPDRGAEHRRQIRRAASDAYDMGVESAATGWEAVRQKAGPMTTTLRARLSDRLATASRAVAPTARDYGLENDEKRMELTPTEARTAVALSRHSRELHGQAREAYAQARDLYYDALVDLDLARTRYRRETPSPAKPARSERKKTRKPDYLTISLVATGCCAAGAATVLILNRAEGQRRQTREKTAFRREAVSDEQLAARVRSAMGRVLSQSSAVEVRALNGSVTLHGPVPAAEFDGLMKCVYAVPGVREVVNQVETHAPAEDLTGL